MNTKQISIAVVALLPFFINVDACHCSNRNHLPKNIGCANEFMAVLSVEGTKLILIH